MPLLQRKRLCHPAEAAVEYSQRAFRGFVVQYKTGTASILDVLTALTALSNARAQLY